MAERERQRDTERRREREVEGGRWRASIASTAINDSFSSDCKASTCCDFFLCFHFSICFLVAFQFHFPLMVSCKCSSCKLMSSFPDSPTQLHFVLILQLVLLPFFLRVVHYELFLACLSTQYSLHVLYEIMILHIQRSNGCGHKTHMRADCSFKKACVVKYAT